MRKDLLFLLFCIIIFSATGYSQLLKGRAINESGSGAAGVTVRFRDHANQVLTNPDGSFRILAVKLPDTLVFSAPGYEPYQVIITEKNLHDPDFEVVLLGRREKDDRSSMGSEVVVTAAAVKRKPKEAGFSTKTISGDELAGKVPGLEISGYGKAESRVLHSDGEVTSGVLDNKKYFFSDTNILSTGGVTARSQILTAGEVNDFNKWKMWEDYSDNEFKSLSQFWGMKTRHRYSVQLTDKKLNALVNEPVYLIHKVTKDTVWKAKTDNTGKAELWASFINDKDDKDAYYISDQSGNGLYSLSEFSNGVNLLQADRPCQLTSDVDIAFVVDATGSMGDEIEFLKLELEDVIRKTMEKYKSLTLRATSVFYRDRGDEFVTKNVKFNDDLLKAINFIKLQQAGGGGDYPEAVDSALATALDSLQWNSHARTRLLFLVLDAPPHNEAIERIQQLVIRAAALGIRIVPVACSGTDKSTEFLLRTMALATNGTYAFLTDHSGIGNDHIEPTTDKYQVELLNDLLQRVIGQFLFARDCMSAPDEKLQSPDIHQPANILSVKIYPNPTNGRFTLESNQKIREIFVTDFTGKILMRLAVEDKKGRWEVDISRYPAGTYLVKYITTENKWGAEKVILIH